MVSKIKTLIVDDSAVVRQVLSDILKTDPSIELLGAAADPLYAMDMMEKQWPDVILLDLEMPRMDGLTFLRKIMAERPTPVVVCSTLAEKGAQATIQVLSAGAVDVITKPKVGLQGFFYEVRSALIDTIKAATRANLKRLQQHVDLVNAPKPASGDESLRDFSSQPSHVTTEQVIAIGASTGGTQAIEVVLKDLPPRVPCILIVLHMPVGFPSAFAKRLSEICQLEVKEAEHLDKARQGRVLIAPGDRHMLLKRSGHEYYVELKDGPVINRHRPSVDVLFRSVAQCTGRNAVGVIMSGMGEDGARGLEEMHKMGAFTIAQSEDTSVVYGMAKEAIRRGAVDKILPLEAIAGALLQAEKISDLHPAGRPSP
jgi:two-component system chemotaxis response regulator CheB